MLHMIAQRRAAITKEERDDLFSNLLAANDEEEGEQKLSDEELIGACFCFDRLGTYLTRLSNVRKRLDHAGRGTRGIYLHWLQKP